jgi:hypothetical protein
MIKSLLPQTPDPDTGLIYERKFIPLSTLNNYLKWGEIGEVIVDTAKQIYKDKSLPNNS